MTERISGKKIAPAAIQALREALVHVYWYKSDLRSFLTQALSDPTVLSRLDWDAYKRDIVGQLVDFLAGNEDVYQRQLIQLMVDVSAIADFSHLSRLEDGQAKAAKAKDAVEALQHQVRGLEVFLEEGRKIERNRQAAHEKLVKTTAVQEALQDLTAVYMDLLGPVDPQARGYKLEKILLGLFDLFDLDPRASFRVVGEQIDGAFSFDSTDYLLEAKWQKALVGSADLDSMAGKLNRRLDNTLGLYLSVNGYSEDGVRAHQSGRSLTILMDGSDLMAVLEGRIDLIQLLLRKRRAAAQTGNIYLRIHEVLGSSV